MNMKTFVLAAALSALLAGAAQAQGMGTPPPPPRPVCLWTYMIDHTTTVDPTTVVFHMKNGAAWKNSLQAPCPGLKFHGFVYVVRGGDQICSNAQSIRVIETNEVCALGAFTPAGPPPAPAAYKP
jgi:hypothetical protein